MRHPKILLQRRLLELLQRRPAIKLIASDELGRWVPEGLVGGQTQRAERRYPWQPWKREPPLKWPLTGTVTLEKKISMEILTRENTYLKTTYMKPPATRQGGRRGGENPQRFAKKEQLIRYNQQAKQQCNITSATSPQRGPATPQRAARHVTYCNR